MSGGRGKRAAIGAAVLCVLTVAAALVAFRTRLVEEWYIWNLGRGRGPERFEAALQLVKMRSTRAVRPLLRLVLSPGALPDVLPEKLEDLSPQIRFGEACFGRTLPKDVQGRDAALLI